MLIRLILDKTLSVCPSFYLICCRSFFIFWHCLLFAYFILSPPSHSFWFTWILKTKPLLHQINNQMQILWCSLNVQTVFQWICTLRPFPIISIIQYLFLIYVCFLPESEVPPSYQKASCIISTIRDGLGTTDPEISDF